MLEPKIIDPPKDPSERYTIKLDLDLQPGDSIATENPPISFNVEVAFGTDPSEDLPASFFEGEKELDTANGVTGVKRTLKAGGGVHGVDYRLIAEADTVNGEHLKTVAIIPVRNKR